MRYYSVIKKRKRSPWFAAVAWVFVFCFALWLVWIQWTSGYTGNLGQLISGGLFKAFGLAAYLFPPLLIYGLAVILRRYANKPGGSVTLLFGITITLLAASTELAVFKTVFESSAITGGATGATLAVFLAKIGGTLGAALFALALLAAGLHILFEISWTALAATLLNAVVEDYKKWVEARAELKTRVETAAKREIEIRRPELHPAPEEELKPVPIVQREPEPKPAAQPKKSKAEKQEVQAKPAPAQAKGEFQLPPSSLLQAPPVRAIGPTDEEITSATRKLGETLQSFNIEADVTGVSPGPVVTRYEIKPRPGVKISSIVALSNDIALAMKAHGIRVEAPIPGKDAIGFEIPNEKPAVVYMREIIEDPHFTNKKGHLQIALGRNAEGAPATANLEKMPHVLIAGATNSGKSICLHSIIMSILYRSTPSQVKFLLIDPKRLELTFYEKIPHLYDPKTPCQEATVVTDPKGAVKSLQSLVKVMENRYLIFEAAKVKNIESYNRWAAENGQIPVFYIVVVIDELADLMMQTKAAVEDSVQRLAQMARAVGIHLVLSTQRPSVDVITGVIKANLPSRIALQVASKTDSRVIIDGPGADSLLGKGDMLYLAIDAQKPARIQGAYISEEEITKAADFLRAQGAPDYPEQLPQEKNAESADGLGASSVELRQALSLIMERRRVSQDLLKAHFGSSARATNILSILEMKGFIHKPEGSNRWEILFDKIEHQLSMLESQNALEEVFSPEGEKE